MFDGHWGRQDVLENKKPDDRITTTLTVSQVNDLNLNDEVKYMAIDDNSFYDNLQNREAVRNAMAAEGGYEPSDLPDVALKILSLEELGPSPDGIGLPQWIVDMIGEPSTYPGLKNAIYLDYVSGKYVLAFAGTDSSSIDDWITNALQGIGYETEQYNAAMDIAIAMKNNPIAGGNMVITGHSLGGGLASAAAVVTGIHADTWNSAGLLEDTILDDDGNEIVLGAQANYDNADALINAYYLDWDILSFVQDKLDGIGLLQPAIGHRIEMDGPLDFAVNVALFVAAATANPLAFYASLGTAGYYMGLAHTSNYYHHGLLVDEDTGWDIHGGGL